MGKIFYIIGKSSTGKDTILARLLGDESLNLREIIQYTTRPMRAGETEGSTYHFITDEQADAFDAAGKLVELRAYNTVHGVWKYMMVDDGQVDLSANNYAAVGTIASYARVAKYYGNDLVVPIYIEVETGERLQRALNRERTHEGPKYAEMCRRFLADEADFAPEKLEEAGLMQDGKIRNCFENIEIESCIEAICAFIRKHL